MVQYLGYLVEDHAKARQFTQVVQGELMRRWGIMGSLLLVAQRHRGLASPVDTWEEADMIDRLYYVRLTPLCYY